MKRAEIKEWRKRHGSNLEIGSTVSIKETCEHYEPQYDQDKTYMVVYLFLDAGGLNIGLNEGGGDDDWICGTDGYRIDDLEPVVLDIKDKEISSKFIHERLKRTVISYHDINQNRVPHQDTSDHVVLSFYFDDEEEQYHISFLKNTDRRTLITQLEIMQRMIRGE